MTVLTVYADTSDGSLESDGSTYAAARAGTGTAPYSVGTGYLAGAQSYVSSADIRVLEAFLRFDTSALTSGATISAAVLNLEVNFTGGGAARTIQARSYDWGTTMTGSDWVAGANLGSYPLLAHLAMSGKAANTRYDWSDDALAANINKTGYTPILLNELDQANNAAPTDGYWTAFKDADTAGTVSDPKLVITYTTGITGTGALTLPRPVQVAGVSVPTPWVYQADRQSIPIDVAKPGTDGNPGLGASATASYLIEVFSDPIGSVGVGTLSSSRIIVVAGASAAPPSTTWDTPGVTVTQPAVGSDIATVTLKAMSAPAGATVRLLIAVGLGTPTPTVDHSGETTPSLAGAAPPTSSTSYTWPSTYPAASGRDAQLVTMVVQADILSATGAVIDSRTASAGWYSGAAV
jgi:hypothetical protein